MVIYWIKASIFVVIWWYIPCSKPCSPDVSPQGSVDDLIETVAGALDFFSVENGEEDGEMGFNGRFMGD